MATILSSGRTLDQIRALTRTSVHGRQLGLDRDFLGGVKDIRKVVTEVTTAGTVLPNHGVVVLNSTLGLQAATIATPETGVGVHLVNVATGTTNGWTITSAAGATFTSSAGIGDTKVTVTDLGGNVHLMGISSSRWAVLSGHSTGLFAVAS